MFEDATGDAPFIQNINAMLNHKITKMAKNGLEVAKDYLVEYAEECANKLNENHAKTPNGKSQCIL